jgi:hypothetical protein
MSERNIQTDNLASSSPPSLLERDIPIRSVIKSLMLSSMLVSLLYVLFVPKIRFILTFRTPLPELPVKPLPRPV